MNKKRDELLKEIEHIQSLNGAAQWRAVHDFTLKTNTKIRRENKKFLQQVAEIRENQDNETATSAGGHFRYGLHFPTSIFNAIRAFDPKFMIVDKHKSKDPKDSNKLVVELMEVFPEYKIPRKV